MLFDELISRPSDRELRKIVMKWWNIYENNKKISLNDLAMILLHSAGIKHKTFDMTILRDGFFKRNIFSKDHDLSNAPISLQQFSKILNKFLDILLQKNFWTIIQDLSFIFDLVSVIEFMKESPHDSVRAVSYLSGMKILRQSYYFSEYLITANIPNKTTIIQKIEELKSKLHNNFRHSMRDKSAYLRMIPLKELLFWSGDNPDIMIEEYIRKYILRALRDSFIVNRKIALNIFCKIFENPSVFNREKQQNLFSKLIPELTISLRSNEELDFLILKIMNQASKFLDVVVTPEEELNISMCLYSENESVLDEAKIYFYNNYFKGKVGVNIISETFKFYRKCPVKNTTQFVKNLVSYYADHTTWQDWEFCLKSCCDNDINDYLNIFYHYVTFINRPSLNDLDSSTKNKMRDQFSVSFSKCWLQLMETDKIAMNSYAQVFMLKLATSFNILKLSKKINTTIIDWSLKNFLQGNNHEVLKECLLCIHFLNSFNTNILIEKMLISHVLTGFIELLKNENEETEIINLSHYKVHLLVNTYEDSYENLWESLVSLLEKESDLKKVQLIISVLHHLVMNKMKKYIDFLNIEEKSSQCFILKVQITSYSAIVIKAASNFISNAYQHINENGNLAKMMVCIYLFNIFYFYK
ncbi:unnamed protein product [Nezara viridula]|uniref:Uncharacterized protein n=1 Tax=Nezara viridula TaxID=85310 RepID=A0A9P0EBI7_NEZVI|nr:unnamed protein product [Nezara viridula]